MTKEQIVNFLGLAMRAGKVKTGESVILNDLKKNKLKLKVRGRAERRGRLWERKCSSYTQRRV